MAAAEEVAAAEVAAEEAAEVVEVVDLPSAAVEVEVVAVEMDMLPEAEAVEEEVVP